MSKAMKAFIIIISCVVCLVVAATAGLSVMTFIKVNAIETATVEDIPEGGVEGEDDVLIGGEYWIRSTKAISDAFISGDSSQLSDKDKETLEMASSILGEIITDGMSDYDKEKAVVLWINKNIGNDPDVNVLVRDDVTTDNPHGVLSSRNAVCVGYATTFRLFMQMLDIPCMVVHNTDLVHSWDLVQIDGHWYHVDMYAAQGQEDPYQYMNLDDTLRETSGYTWDRSFYPAADSLEKCYIYEKAKKTDDVYSIPGEIKKAVEDKESFITLLFADGEGVQQLAEYLLNTLGEKLSYAVDYQGKSISHTVSIMQDGSALVYIQFYYYNSEDDIDDNTVTEEEQERVEKAITDAFGELEMVDYGDGDYYDGSYYGGYGG